MVVINFHNLDYSLFAAILIRHSTHPSNKAKMFFGFEATRIKSQTSEGMLEVNGYCGLGIVFRRPKWRRSKNDCQFARPEEIDSINMSHERYPEAILELLVSFDKHERISNYKDWRMGWRSQKEKISLP
jgi:hypothetical protein